MLPTKPAKSLLIGIIALSALSACTITPTPTNGTAPTTVSQIRLDDYLGKWYEIGRLPMSFQDKCTHNVTATYSLKDNGKINVLNACATKDGMASVNGEAYATDETNAKLRVSFLPSFLKKLPIGKANYWVLASDQDTSGRYTSALVGTPNHKYLWVLSRTPTLDDATYERYLGIAKQNGYELSKFTKTPQK
ncbi:lipocalin family protein [Moraxella sp. K127]|uniref:lipocalin family protein n=1 Tax=Moraxella sp. K127 TaxID=2780079 RepID=UPI001880EE42|nr:lipocalin family protein [Moraxella sp. K127]MBE9591617.1 lipocalin family protein [Moraxella sp. K127]